MKALHRVVQGIFKAAGTFGDSRLTSRGGRCISFGHCVVNFLCGGFTISGGALCVKPPHKKRWEAGGLCALWRTFFVWRASCG